MRDVDFRPAGIRQWTTVFCQQFYRGILIIKGQAVGRQRFSSRRFNIYGQRSGAFRVLLCTYWLCLLPHTTWGEEIIHYDDEQQAALAAYKTCLLKHVQPAQSPVAASHLQQACQRQFAPVTSAVAKNGMQDLSASDEQHRQRENYRLFDECLLHYLPTVHNDPSANALLQLCKEQFGGVVDATVGQQPNKIMQLLGFGIQQPSHAQPNKILEGDAFVPLRPWQAGQSR